MRITSTDGAVLANLHPEQVPELAESSPSPHPDLDYEVGAGRSPYTPWYEIMLGGRRLAWATSPPVAARLLLSHLEEKLAELARDEVFVHAGVVAWQGRAIVLPGPSYAGKSMLVAEFLRRGAVYYSDEFAVVGLGGKIRPYPRPLHLRTGSLPEPLRQWDPVPAGRCTAGEGILPAAVIFARYVRGRGSRWAPLPPGLALLHLLAYTPGARRFPREALARLRPVVELAPAYAVRRAEARPAVDAVLRLLPESPAPRKGGF